MLLIAPYAVLAQDGRRPKGAGSKAGGKKCPAEPLFTARDRPQANAVPPKKRDHALGDISVTPCRLSHPYLVQRMEVIDVPQKAQVTCWGQVMSHRVNVRTLWGTCERWLSRLRRGIMGQGDEVSHRAAGGTLWGACGGGVSAKRSGITICGDEVSHHASGCTLSDACGGWLSPKRRKVTGEGGGANVHTLWSSCSRLLSPKGRGTTGGETKCPAMPLVALFGVLMGDGHSPNGGRSLARGEKCPELPALAFRSATKGDGCPPKGGRSRKLGRPFWPFK